MINKLRRRFILIAMGSFALVVAIIIGAINTVNMMQINSQTKGILQLIDAYDGDIPIKNERPNTDFGIAVTEEFRFSTRYFTVRYDKNNTVTQINTGHIAAISSEQAVSLSDNVLGKGVKSGFSGIYKFLISERSDGVLVIFLDCRAQLDQADSFLLVSCFIAIIGLTVVFALIFALSKKAIKPIVESIQKQKRFITDAGHEIKTPLAIISANTDVLMMTGSDNEWVRSIKNQTVRLNDLVQSMLTLSKAAEVGENPMFLPFSLSDAVMETAKDFITVAEMKNKKMTVNAAENISYTGNEKELRELVSILCDNAVKYADEGGEIWVSLTRKGKKILLEVKNTAVNIDKENLSHLFDRFYRADEARSRDSGGFGIGLSVAAAVAESHKAKIWAEATDEKTVSFFVSF